jgi:N-acyl-D-amino-acid deacylase
MFDLIIANATVIDGSGDPAIRADLGIIGERIDAIGDLSSAEAKRTIDAEGLVAAPGFIDTHAHCDGALLSDPQHDHALRQGVTTEIIGPDGITFSQLSPENYQLYRTYMRGVLGDLPEEIDVSSMEAFLANYHRKTSINVAAFVSHGSVRLEAAGFIDVPLTGDLLARAKTLVREGIEQGGVGLATGLSYLPQSFSDTEEIVQLSREANEHGSVYVTHTRNVNVDRAFGGGGITEALEIGRQSGIPVHIEHLRTGPTNAGQTDKLMAPIDKAKAEGVDVSMEIYPYPAGSGTYFQYFPPEYSDGGPEALLRNLTDPANQKEIAAVIDADLEGVKEDQVFSHIGSEKNSDLLGMSWRDAAAIRGVSVGTLLCAVAVEENFIVGRRGTPPDSTALWNQVSRDSMELLSRPDYMIGSDCLPAQRYPHPRAYGTFPRIVGRLLRQSPVSLETIIQRTSSDPALRFGIKDRGFIKKGHFADIVLFDPDTVIDTATYDDPIQFPAGIPFVIVNGEVAVDNNKSTGVIAGQAVS